MKKNLLREIVEPDISILNEDKKDGTMKILAPWVQAGVENLNHRIYPEKLLRREVDRVQEKISRGSFIGTGDHPASGLSDIATASHIVQKLSIDESGKGFVELKIFPSPRGKSAMEIIRAGGRLGISSRGFGTINPLTKIVEDDYQLQGLDLVTNPSSNIANFNADNIFESVEDFTAVETEVEKKARLIKEHHEEAVKVHEKAGIESKENIMWLMYNTHINAGEWRGSFEKWRKIHEKFIDVALAEVNENLTYQEALEKVMGEEEAEKILAKEANIQQRVESKDVYLEAMVAGISPRLMAERINKEVNRQNEDAFEEETQAILREAQSAGLNTADEKVREKLLNDALQRKIDTPAVLTETQKAKKIVKEAEEEEVQKYSFLAAEKISAGYKK